MPAIHVKTPSTSRAARRTPTRARNAPFFALLLSAATSAHCGGSVITEAGVDAPATDAADAPSDTRDAEPLPPGPRGQILGVPQTMDEDWAIPTLRAPVQVVRTEANIPHVYAANQRDAYVVQGFIVARDRYVQIELARRLGLGLISNLLGDAGLAVDQQSRDRGMTLVADRVISQLTPEQGEMFDAYVEGINAYIAQVRARRLPLPTELGPVGLLLGTTRPYELMLPLTRRDLAGVLAAVLYNSSFTTDDLARANVAATLPGLFRGATDEALRRDATRRDIFERVAPLTDVTSAPGFGLENGSVMSSRTRRRPRVRTREGAPTVPRDVIERALRADEGLALLRRGLRDADHGSNAWATAGRANAEGAAILSGDGHLPLSIPTLLFQMGSDATVFGDAAAQPPPLLGLFFPGVPVMALGTNARVAWSFTYLYGDLVDYYAEEVQLDANGRPSASRFRGEWRPLAATDERYEIANVPALNSMGRTETWTRWSTFDGRFIASIEGRPATRETVPGAGESVVAVQGQLVVPADTNGDGRISAVSFDYAGFDVSNVLLGLTQFERAQSVRDVRAAQRRFVGFAQNFVAADSAGGIHYSGYTGAPCRRYLPRTDGAWNAGADPRLLLDGTQYGAFTIPLDAQGVPDESMNETDPQRCVIPFDQWPASLNPDRGYVLTANNDLGGTSMDNSLANDAYYLGGPWDPGYRARTIRDSLAGHVAARTSTIDAMAALQGDHHSTLARVLVPFLRDAVETARRVGSTGTPATPSEQRMLALYQSEREAIDEVLTRLDAWLARGANAASGVATFYDTPTADDRADAAATMLLNAFYRALNAAMFDDEGIDAVFDTDARFLRATALLGAINGRGPGNPAMLAGWNPATQETVFWDVLGTPEVESSREVAVLALTRALATLREAPGMMGTGGFGTRDMSQYLWGLRHQVALESILTSFGAGVMGVELISNQLRISTARLPLAADIPAGDPRRDLLWFPRPGDFFSVDAANPGYRGADYVYRNGPVMRMVVELRGGRVRGQNILPGGQSGVARSANFDDQARLWLGNRALPMRYDVDAVVAGATGREVYHP